MCFNVIVPVIDIRNTSRSSEKTRAITWWYRTSLTAEAHADGRPTMSLCFGETDSQLRPFKKLCLKTTLICELAAISLKHDSVAPDTPIGPRTDMMQHLSEANP